MNLFLYFSCMYCQTGRYMDLDEVLRNVSKKLNFNFSIRDYYEIKNTDPDAFFEKIEYRKNGPAVLIFPLCVVEVLENHWIPVTKPLLSFMKKEKIKAPGAHRYTEIKLKIEPKPKPFEVPTVEMVTEYMKEKTNSTSYSKISGPKFWNYYNDREWKINRGKSRMRDWKISASGWISRNYDNIPIVVDGASPDYGTLED